jgi:hypothetical protein
VAFVLVVVGMVGGDGGGKVGSEKELMAEQNNSGNRDWPVLINKAVTSYFKIYYKLHIST